MASWVGAFGWAFVWMQASWTPGDEAVLGPYVLLIGLVSTLFPPRFGQLQAVPWWPGRAARPEDAPVGALVGMTLSAAMTLVLLNTWLTPFVVAVTAAFVALAALLQNRNLVDGRLAVVAGALVVLAILTWPMLPVDLSGPPFGRPVQSGPTGLADLVAANPLLILSALALVSLIWISGVLAMARNRDPELATAVAAAVPLLVHVILYHRLGGFRTSGTWAGIAMAIALANLWAAHRAARWRGDVGDAPLSAFAAAVTGGLALALACLLRGPWLPVALSAEVLAARLDLDAAAGAGPADPRGDRRPRGDRPADRTDRHRRRPRSGRPHRPRPLRLRPALGDALGLRSASSRRRPASFRGWSRMPPSPASACWPAALPSTTASAQASRPLIETALHALWWLLVAAGLLRGGQPAPRPALTAAGNALMAASLAALVLGCTLLFNPLVTGDPVGRLPVLNALGLAYLLPAVLLALARAVRPPHLLPRLRRLVAPAAGLLASSTSASRPCVSSRARRLHLRLAGEAELYAVSIVWLGYALALLAAAFRFGFPRSEPPRSSCWRPRFSRSSSSTSRTSPA